MTPRSARRTWPRRAAILGLALLPTLAVAWRAGVRGGGDDRVEERRRRILASLPRDSTVLINVTAREMPASPDILNLGKRSTHGLERCLSDNVDPELRRFCAALLGQLGDRRALPTLRAALDAWEPQVRRAVIVALRQIPDKDSFDPLMKVFNRNDEEPGNQIAVLETLGALSSTKAVAVLRKELHRTTEEGETDRRPEAFAALWRSRHLMARGTLVEDVAYALRSDNNSLARAATGVAAELRAPRLGRDLIPLLQHQWADVRNKAVYALGRIGDRSATKALLAALPKVREARMLNNIAFALERLDRKAFYAAMQEIVKHKQAIIRLNAAFVLGDVRRPEGLSLLAKALADPSDYVRTSAIVALGKLGTREAIKLIEPYVSHENPSIRQEAIYALHALSGGKRADLIYSKLFLAKTRNEAIHRRAALALGDSGDGRAREYLLSCLELQQCRRQELLGFLRADRDPRVTGRLLLAWAQGRRDLTDLVAEVKPSGALPVALSAVDAYLARNRSSLARDHALMARRAIDLVGDLGDSAARERLRPRVDPRHAWLRFHTAVALARLGDVRADQVILQDLDNLPAEWMPRLARALMRIEEKSVRDRLKVELVKRQKDPDPTLALAAAAVHLRWDPEGAFFRFLDALAAPSVMERDLAERYLRRDRAPKLTWLLRRAAARETRPYTRDRLRLLLDAREQS